MRRRFNYTGRVRLLEKDVQITVLEPEPKRTQFTADLNLKDYDLPPDAPVWIEVYHRYAVLRFLFGTVENPRTAKPCDITEIAGTDIFHFRVKVVDPANQSRLLGLAKHINAFSPEDENAPARSLLRLGQDDLNGRPWKLDFPPGQYPILYIDQQFDAGKSLATLNIFFQGAVFPQIFETILEKVLFSENYRPSGEVDPEDQWKADWLAFAESLPGVARLESDSDGQDGNLRIWIDEAVESFSKQFNAIRKMRMSLKELET